MSEKFPPDYIRIPTPRFKGLRPRGNTSNKSADPQHTIRFPEDMMFAIDRACEELGVTRSEFIRWTAYSSALEVHTLHEQYKRDNP